MYKSARRAFFSALACMALSLGMSACVAAADSAPAHAAVALSKARQHVSPVKSAVLVGASLAPVVVAFVSVGSALRTSQRERLRIPPLSMPKSQPSFLPGIYADQGAEVRCCCLA